MLKEIYIQQLSNIAYVKYLDVCLKTDQRSKVLKLIYMSEINAYDKVLERKLTFTEID